jgi:hypothetical protein
MFDLKTPCAHDLNQFPEEDVQDTCGDDFEEISAEEKEERRAEAKQKREVAAEEKERVDQATAFQNELQKFFDQLNVRAVCEELREADIEECIREHDELVWRLLRDTTSTAVAAASQQFPNDPNRHFGTFLAVDAALDQTLHWKVNHIQVAPT